VPPHCDSLDGPVVQAARAALEAGDVSLVLPYVHADGEDELRSSFEAVLQVRDLSPLARDVADRLFFETVVRVHRAGENAPYTGLKPAGLDVGPVIPLAERAGANLSVDELADFLADEVRRQVVERVDQLRDLASVRSRSLEDERSYVEAALGLQVWSHRLYRQMSARTEH
jgi:hypothetical protein